MAICFLARELISLAILALAGKMHATQLLAALYLFPAVMIDSGLSRMTYSRIGGKGLRISVLVFAIVSGLVLIFR